MDVKPPQAARGQSSASIAFRLRLSLAGSSGLIGRVSNGLAAGQSFTSADQIAVKVDSAVAGGFSITATNNAMETEPRASARIQAAGFMPKFVAARKPAAARGAVKKRVVKKLEFATI
jgi:hypothetical protein